MGTNTLKKAGARAGGLAAALAVAGAVGVGGASAAEASSCHTPNPHVNCDPSVNTGVTEADRIALGCAVKTAPAWAGGPTSGLGGYTSCVVGTAIMP